MRVGANTYKIGIARNVRNRLKQIQTSNSELVEVVAKCLVKNPEQAERKIHKLLSEYKLDGGKEWFKLTNDQALQIAVHLNKLEEADIADFIMNHLSKDIKKSIFNYEKMQTEMIKNQKLRNDLINDMALRRCTLCQLAMQRRKNN